MFLYIVLLTITIWFVLNVEPQFFGLPQFDPPPFAWLQLSLSLSSLLMTVGVLITQNRQEKLAEQRAQLNLQLSMLSEQKVAKLITLVEELRKDLPNVKDRHDPEAEVMQETTDPHVLLEVLEETLEEQLTALQQEEKGTSGQGDKGTRE
jgi:uncharacterized membrane protein